MIEYSGSLIPLDLSLPDPEDPSNPPESGQIGSSLYSIDREHGWIYGISPSTSAAAFRGNLAGEGEFTLLRNQQVISSGNAGTGMVIQLSQDGVVSDTLTLIVYAMSPGKGTSTHWIFALSGTICWKKKDWPAHFYRRQTSTTINR